MSNNKTIEENFNELNKIIEKMENEEVALEETFELYTEGLKLIKDCNNKIDKVEKKIKIIESEESDE